MMNAHAESARAVQPITFEEACKIMPKGRVVSIHDTVHFLGLEPQAIESAIDPFLYITADELARIADRGTYVLLPVVGLPHHLVGRAKNMLAAEEDGMPSRRLNPSKVTRARSLGYRLIQINPDPQTIGRDFMDQQNILARTDGQRVACAHSLALAALIFYEMHGLNLIGHRTVRTSDMIGSGTRYGMRFKDGSVHLSCISKLGQLGVGAIGEIVL